MITLNLTDKEIEVLDDYIFRKVCRLLDSGLEDSKCCIQLSSVHKKIQKELKKTFTK